MIAGHRRKFTQVGDNTRPVTASANANVDPFGANHTGETDTPGELGNGIHGPIFMVAPNEWVRSWCFSSSSRICRAFSSPKAPGHIANIALVIRQLDIAKPGFFIVLNATSSLQTVEHRGIHANHKLVHTDSLLT
jgi:hypothetical protein